VRDQANQEQNHENEEDDSGDFGCGERHHSEPQSAGNQRDKGTSTRSKAYKLLSRFDFVTSYLTHHNSATPPIRAAAPAMGGNGTEWFLSRERGWVRISATFSRVVKLKPPHAKPITPMTTRTIQNLVHTFLFRPEVLVSR